MPEDQPDDENKELRQVSEAIAEEVRKDQGATPTFPFGERELEEKTADGLEDAAIREAREKAEIGRVPGGGSGSTRRASQGGIDDQTRDTGKIRSEDPIGGENVPLDIPNLNSV